MKPSRVLCSMFLFAILSVDSPLLKQLINDLQRGYCNDWNYRPGSLFTFGSSREGAYLTQRDYPGQGADLRFLRNN